ncbi:G protein-coupled glucose receptor regulating Gpa2-domain-containing protein [Amylocarpus encephaloides]|uniref:G protein-coupled glucose receptor regulating Gpa2-domain-containing protein n=1 Tax=Amylocarpus encephaloides TaxID=45428 RepID=A0A9P7YT71_9HELO|nr:G protein-coupled glucose receptor regulating Gpa2-domain-containing protein [Amylocarpus encephaloides]
MVSSNPLLDSTPSEAHTLNAVIIIVSLLSALGAALIIASFAAFSSLRTFRHQLILGLAISDLCMALNFLISSSVNLHGPSIGSPDLVDFCSFNGFMTQVFVVQTDYWVLTIAICTYLILADHKRESTWAQDHRIVMWVLPWVISIVIGTLGLVLVGYGDIGAWCWFVSDRLRLLINFIPRWIIIFTILTLYARLYFLIHKAHTGFTSFSDEALSDLPTNSSSSRSPADVLVNSRFGTNATVLRRISIQMMVYPLVYMLTWTIPTTIRIYQSTSGEVAPFGVGTLDKSCIVIQGFADAIVYGLNESTWKLWRKAVRRNGEKR